MVALKAFLSAHGEKTALAASASLLAAYLAWGFLIDQRNEDALHVRELTRATEAERDREHADLSPGRFDPHEARTLAHHHTVLPAVEVNSWACSFASIGVVIGKPVPTTEPPSLPGLAVTAVLKNEESITLRFSITPPAKGLAATFDSIRLERRINSEAWSAVSTLKPDTTAIDDPMPSPHARIEYRAILITTDKEWIAANKRTEGDPSPTAAVTMPSWFRAAVLTSDPETKTAFLTLERYLPGKGWTKTQELHTIGKSTLLNAVRDVGVVVKDRRCIRQFANGALIGCKEVEEDRKVTVREVLLVDDAGETITLRPNEPKAVDTRCPDHKK